MPEGARLVRERAKALLALRPNPGAQTNAPASTAAGVAPRSPRDADLCALANGRSASIAACTRLLVYNPKDSAAYGNRGQSFLLRDEFVRAIIDFDQVLKLDPANARARKSREFALFAAPPQPMAPFPAQGKPAK